MGVTDFCAVELPLGLFPAPPVDATTNTAITAASAAAAARSFPPRAAFAIDVIPSVPLQQASPRQSQAIPRWATAVATSPTPPTPSQQSTSAATENGFAQGLAHAPFKSGMKPEHVLSERMVDAMFQPSEAAVGFEAAVIVADESCSISAHVLTSREAKLRWRETFNRPVSCFDVTQAEVILASGSEIFRLSFEGIVLSKFDTNFTDEILSVRNAGPFTVVTSTNVCNLFLNGEDRGCSVWPDRIVEAFAFFPDGACVPTVLVATCTRKLALWRENVVVAEVILPHNPTCLVHIATSNDVKTSKHFAVCGTTSGMLYCYELQDSHLHPVWQYGFPSLDNFDPKGRSVSFIKPCYCTLSADSAAFPDLAVGHDDGLLLLLGFAVPYESCSRNPPEPPENMALEPTILFNQTFGIAIRGIAARRSEGFLEPLRVSFLQEGGGGFPSASFMGVPELILRLEDGRCVRMVYCSYTSSASKSESAAAIVKENQEGAKRYIEGQVKLFQDRPSVESQNEEKSTQFTSTFSAVETMSFHRSSGKLLFKLATSGALEFVIFRADLPIKIMPVERAEAGFFREFQDEFEYFSCFRALQPLHQMTFQIEVDEGLSPTLCTTVIGFDKFCDVHTSVNTLKPLGLFERVGTDNETARSGKNKLSIRSQMSRQETHSLIKRLFNDLPDRLSTAAEESFQFRSVEGDISVAYNIDFSGPSTMVSTSPIPVLVASSFLNKIITSQSRSANISAAIDESSLACDALNLVQWFVEMKRLARELVLAEGMAQLKAAGECMTDIAAVLRPSGLGDSNSRFKLQSPWIHLKARLATAAFVTIPVAKLGVA
ncbi:hypothetical protein DFJ73DRAFT_815096 [Zopfochytrium polystomum]|nr:hypothetical protein DFJ73DRAFT_815096 [Zopfochytrium polystomum]